MKKIVQILIIIALIFGCSKEDDINNLEFEATNIDISPPNNDFEKYDIEEIVYSLGNRPNDELLDTKIAFDTIVTSVYENSVVTIRVNEIVSRLKYDNFTFIYKNFFIWDDTKKEFVQSEPDSFEILINLERIFYKGSLKNFENIDFNLIFKGTKEGRYKIIFKFFTETLLKNYSKNPDRGLFHSSTLEFNFKINS